MDLLKLLRQLQSIEPGEDYARRSKQIILGTPTRSGGIFPYLSRWFIHGVQMGSSVVLAVLLFVVIVGGFSIWSAITPFNLASLDPKSLRAEAEAVDIQIQLTNIAYSEPVHPVETTTPAVAPSTPPVKEEVKEQAKKQAENLGFAPATSSEETVIEVDEALDRLAE